MSPAGHEPGNNLRRWVCTTWSSLIGGEKTGVIVETKRNKGEAKTVIAGLARRASSGRYVVTSSVFDFAAFRERRCGDLGPGHAVDALADCLGASIVQPGDRAVTRIDKLGARLIGTADQWSLARSLVSGMEDGDFVYATGSDVGLAVAITAAVRRRKIKLAIFYSAPARLRPRTLTKVTVKLGIDVLPIAGSDDKVAYLRSLGSGRPAVLASEQTDTSFFRPPEDRSELARPLITSCGLEQRDYAALADAIGPLDVDVKICAVSPNFTSSTVVSMPRQLPENIEMRRFEFDELRRLYQNAAVTVVPLLANGYSAGMTAMMEAIACGSPVVITENPGLASDFAARDLVIGVPPGDIGALQMAIEQVLEDPQAARSRADRARAHVLEHHSSDRYVELLCESLTSFHKS